MESTPRPIISSANLRACSTLGDQVSDARTGNPAAVDLVAQRQFDGRTRRAAREGAGEAVVEEHARVVQGDELVLLGGRQRGADDAVDGGREGEVRVRLDESRHQRHAATVDHPGIVAIEALAGAGHRGDAPSGQAHFAAKQARALAIEDQDIGQQQVHDKHPPVE
jgi:hypothetical protein